jgi:hypothetical protein
MWWNEKEDNTLWNWEKGNWKYTISVCMSSNVRDVSYRHIYWMVLLMTSGDGYGGFIAPSDNGDEHRALGVWTFRRNFVLR